MAEDVVFDYAASAPWAQVIAAYGGEDELDRAIEEMMTDGMGGDDCWEAIWDHEVRRFEADPGFREAVRDIYASAGVDLLSVTPWIHEENVSASIGQRRDLSRWQARFEAAPWLHKVTSPAEARKVAPNDGVGVVLNTQDAGAAIERLEGIDVLYNEGVRIFQLTYNDQNLLGTGCNDTSAGGLSEFGRNVVDRINDLGGIVDVSHCGKQTTLDAIEYSDDPVAVTHAACQAVAEHYRGKSDEEIEALADADGYMGIVTLPWFIAPGVDDPSLAVFLDHLEHAASILGPERVGIGTDFFPADRRFPEALVAYYKEYIIRMGFDREKVAQRTTIAGGIGDFESYEDWPAIRRALGERFSTAEIEAITGESFLTFWERVA
jgi:membrane dipeptidase